MGHHHLSNFFTLTAAFLSTVTASAGQGGSKTIPSSTSSSLVDEIYAFGDSYSDGGESGEWSAFNLSKRVMSTQPLPKDATWLPGKPDSDYVSRGKGRWTNGPTAVEVLAAQLDVPLVNYAVGGAMTGPGNYCTWLDAQFKTGLLGQIEEFISTKPEISDKTLFFLFASANDYFKAADDYFSSHQAPIGDLLKVNEVVDQSIAHMNQAIRNLAAMGARHFMVVGSSDLSVVPWETYYSRAGDASWFTASFNEKLRVLVKELERSLTVQIVLFDHADFTQKLRLNAAQYGITELNEPCAFTQYPDEKTAAARPICKNPDARYFWDEYHPTRKVHELVGEEMKSDLVKAGLVR